MHLPTLRSECDVEWFGVADQGDGLIAFDKSNGYDPENPTGHYKLDLQDRHQRATAMMIWELARIQDGQNIRNAKLSGAVYSESEDSILHLPDTGVLEFDYFEVKRMQLLSKWLKTHRFQALFVGSRDRAACSHDCSS